MLRKSLNLLIVLVLLTSLTAVKPSRVSAQGQAAEGDIEFAPVSTTGNLPPTVDAGGTVVAWGCGSGYDSGQCAVPAGLSDVTAIAAGGWHIESHSLALKSDGTVVAWGSNSYGETTVPAGLNNVTAISAGVYHNLALKSDGTVVGWGFNGDGAATVPGGLTGVIAIAAGGWHSMALKSDGTVVAWGRGVEGQTSVPAGLTDVTAIAAGWWHGLALKSDGTVVAWGCGVYQDWGQCTVPAGLSGVTAIAASGHFGGSHSLALKGDGTVVAWGATTAPAGLTGVTAIAAGWWHDLALKSDGTVVAWGDNSASQATVPAGLTGVTAIAAGTYHSLAISTVTLTVDAGGPYTVTEGASITVTAAGSDPEGGPLTYEWDLDNDSVFETPGQSVTFSAAGLDGPGTHTVAVRATDSGGLSDTDQATVTVENVVPSITSVSNSGPIDEGSSATIAVTATDPAGANDPLSYEFDCDGDGIYEIGPQPANSYNCYYDDNADYVVNVHVSDDDEGTDTALTTVTVNNDKPTATFTNSTDLVISGEFAILVFTDSSDPSIADREAGFTYLYDCLRDGVFESGDTSSTSFACQYLNSGVYTATGRIRDKDGGFTDYPVAVTVQTPQGATEILGDEVEDLISRGELNQGQGNALTAKLSSIIAKLDQGNTNAAINQLQAFINQVNDLIATGVLSPEEGQPLIDVASRIIAALGG